MSGITPKFKVGDKITWSSVYSKEIYSVVITGIQFELYNYTKLDIEYSSSGSIQHLDNIARHLTKLEQALL